MVGRVLFPFGDEPDYHVRLDRLQSIDHSVWSPYRYFDIYNEIPRSEDCVVISGAMSLKADIDIKCIELNLIYYVQRILITFFVVSPLLLFVLFGRYIYKLLSLNNKIPRLEWQKRVNAISLSLVFPGAIYILGLLSREVYVTVLSFFIFIFWGRPLIFVGIMALIMLSDGGNFVVVLAFVSILYIYTVTYRKFGLKFMYVLTVSGVMIAFLFGQEILSEIAISGMSQKISEIYSNIYGYYDNYPLILRPIITYMTGLYMSPAGVKSVLVYVVASAFLLIYVGKIIRVYSPFKANSLAVVMDRKSRNRSEFHEIVILMAVVTHVCSLVFVLPTHANAKYYMFILPFVVYSLMSVVTKEKIFMFFVVLNVVLYQTLLVYYL